MVSSKNEERGLCLAMLASYTQRGSQPDLRLSAALRQRQRDRWIAQSLQPLARC
jgi:hypothetical protein